MKKFLSVLLSVMMLVLPVLSFAEEDAMGALDAALSFAVNIDSEEDVVKEIANAVSSLSFAAHLQPNLLYAAMNLDGEPLVDLTGEVDETTIKLTSNLLDDKYFSLALDALLGMLLPAQEAEQDTEVPMNLTFENFTAALNDSSIMSMSEVAEWEYDSDVPAYMMTLQFSKADSEKLLDALYLDVKDAPALAHLEMGDVTGSEALANGIDAMKASIPDDADLLVMDLGVDAEGQIVSIAASVNYIATEQDFNIIEPETEDGEFGFETFDKLVRKSVDVVLRRKTAETVVEWNGSAIDHSEDADYQNIFYIDAVMDSDVVSVVLQGGMQDLASNEETIYSKMDITCGSYNVDNMDGILATVQLYSISDEAETPLARVEAICVVAENTLVINLSFGQSEENPDMVSATFAAGPGEVWDTHVTGTEYDVTNLNEETLESLSSGVMMNALTALMKVLEKVPTLASMFMGM